MEYVFKGLIVFLLRRWFKECSTTLASYEHHNMHVVASDFEDHSFMSILPVNMIYSPITVKLDHLTNITVITDLHQNIYF